MSLSAVNILHVYLLEFYTCMWKSRILIFKLYINKTELLFPASNEQLEVLWIQLSVDIVQIVDFEPSDIIPAV